MAGEQAPALTYDAEASVVVVVESHVATRPSPDLQAAPAEGLWLLPADTLSRRLAAQLAMEGDDVVQLEQAVERNDAKEILILVLASEARRQHSLEPPDAVAQELGAATDGGKDGQNPKVETVPEPACWKKLRGVDSYTPASIPKASHILETGLTSFFGLGECAGPVAKAVFQHNCRICSQLCCGGTDIIMRRPCMFTCGWAAGLLSLVHFVLTGSSHYTLLLGSFGANAVLMFAAPAAPFCKPLPVRCFFAASGSQRLRAASSKPLLTLLLYPCTLQPNLAT